ncbi:MAG: biopolymer transporter ExbD [Bacteroidia bacterium]|nr:biopolymer transporter ExbD [Bacteroidia bacterium]
MSEVQDSGGEKKKGKKIRAKKHSTHIDMTPMVDLAFLLLTFFLFTTTLSKPKAMPLIMPDVNEVPDPSKQTPVDDEDAMTIILSKNNRVFYYFGIKEPKVEQASFDATKPNSLRKVIIEKKKECESRLKVGGKTPNERHKVVILIKADKDAKYKNMVDVLDEMNINDVPVYAIVDITPKEIEMISGL